MDEPLSDVVNDIGGAHEPEFDAIALCIGTDLDGNPVTLVDRLCLNRPAVEKVIGDMSICQQEAQVFRNEAGAQWKLALDAKRESEMYQFAALTELFLIIILCVLCMARVASKK